MSKFYRPSKFRFPSNVRSEKRWAVIDLLFASFDLLLSILFVPIDLFRRFPMLSIIVKQTDSFGLIRRIWIFKVFTQSAETANDWYKPLLLRPLTTVRRFESVLKAPKQQVKRFIAVARLLVAARKCYWPVRSRGSLNFKVLNCSWWSFIRWPSPIERMGIALKCRLYIAEESSQRTEQEGWRVFANFKINKIFL